MEGFVVGRAGVGSIAWDGAIDLRDVGAIDLVASGVVRLARATAAVYDAPEAARRKPPRGVGLNRPAVITLVGVARPPSRVDPTGSRDEDGDSDAPRSASASEPPSSSSSAPSFASTLAAASPEFLGWDDATRTWTFRVFHFSRYGIDLSASESESEEDELDDAPGRQPEAAAARRDEADDDVMEVAGEGVAPGGVGVAPPPPRRASPARKPPPRRGVRGGAFPRAGP